MARMTKVCSCCKVERPLSEFYLRPERKNPTPQSICKKCGRKKAREYYQKNKEVLRPKKKQYVQKHREEHREEHREYERNYRKLPGPKSKIDKRNLKRLRENKQKAIDYKGGKCSRCGYHICLAAMEFHHIDPIKKEREISKLKGGTWAKLKKELDKCILLCSNCHRELHSGLNISEDYNE